MSSQIGLALADATGHLAQNPADSASRWSSRPEMRLALAPKSLQQLSQPGVPHILPKINGAQIQKAKLKWQLLPSELEYLGIWANETENLLKLVVQAL